MRGKPTDEGREGRPAGQPPGHEDGVHSPTPRCSSRPSSRSTRSPSALRESAYLTKGVWITLARRARRPRALVLLRGRPRLLRPAPEPEQGGAPPPADLLRAAATASTTIEVALQYNDSYTENVLAFANNINTVDGGTHITGFRRALTRSLNEWAKKAGRPQGRGRQPVGRGRPRGPDRRHQRQADRAAVRGPDQGQARQRRGRGPGRGRARRRDRPAPRGEPGRRPADHREVPHVGPRARRGPQGARPRHPQGRPRRHVPPGQARGLPGARSRQERALHRRGRLGRRLRQAGPRPPVPGDPAAARQAPQRREGAARQDPELGERQAADHRARRRHRRDASTSRSCGTTGSSS